MKFFAAPVLAVTYAVSAFEVCAQQIISMEQYRSIESAVRATPTDFSYREFILQKPIGRGVYCGWIAEDFGKTRSQYPQIVFRLFAFYESKNANDGPLIFVDRPELLLSLVDAATVNLCHEAGYITARMPVGVYADQYLERMVRDGLRNNFTLLNKM